MHRFILLGALALCVAAALQTPPPQVTVARTEPDSVQLIVVWQKGAPDPDVTGQDLAYFFAAHEVHRWRDRALHADTVWLPRDIINVEGIVRHRWLWADSVPPWPVMDGPVARYAGVYFIPARDR